MKGRLLTRLGRLEQVKGPEYTRPWQTLTTYSDRPGLYFTGAGETLAEKDVSALQLVRNIIFRHIILGQP